MEKTEIALDSAVGSFFHELFKQYLINAYGELGWVLWEYK